MKECPICNKVYNKTINLRNHLILECISLDLENNTKNNDLSIINNNSIITANNNPIITGNNNPIITSNNNPIITGNNNSIININNINNINVYSPISFDNEWNTDHMSNEEKNLLIVSMVKYTKTLEYLLKNKNNQNVLIDKDSNTGLVYKNNILEKMTLSEICDKSFDKLYYTLNKMYDSENINIGMLDPEYIDIQKKSMNIKYRNYKDDEENKDIANHSMIEIFNKVKDQTLEKFNKIENIKQNIGY